MFPTTIQASAPWNCMETVTVRLEDATMEQAIEWMNAPTDVLSRFERKHALLTYINTRIELTAIKETKSGKGG